MIAAATSAGAFTGHDLETIARREFGSGAVVIPHTIPGQHLIVAKTQGAIMRGKARHWGVLATVYTTSHYGLSSGARDRALARVIGGAAAAESILAEIRHLSTRGRQFTPTLVVDPDNTHEKEQ